MTLIKQFVSADNYHHQDTFLCHAKSPSNIALVKYWGKHAGQIPANASLSFTLKNCATNTTLKAFRRKTTNNDVDFKVYLKGVESPNFKPKIKVFFERTITYLPFIKDYRFEIHTENSFPHSSGIASSASGMAALAMCLMQMEYALLDISINDAFYQKASFLARLGSGSACRSIKGSAVIWGKHEDFKNANDLYGVPFEAINPIFRSYHDTILLIDKGEKKVGSSAGHGLMDKHPFAKARFKQAHQNLSALKTALINGDLAQFGTVLESEALTLHAMMMTSTPYYVLQRPATLQAIEEVWDFRRATKRPLYFTLDAGANLHLLYPQAHAKAIQIFIESKLKHLCQGESYINDVLGEGSVVS